MKSIFHHFHKKRTTFENPFIVEKNHQKSKKRVTNKDVDLSDDLIFDREIKGIKQIGQETQLTETGCIHIGTGREIRQKEFSEIFCRGIRCDCCGNSISPFSFNTLCEKCQERMDKDMLYSKIFETDREKQNVLDKVWFVKQNIKN